MTKSDVQAITIVLPGQPESLNTQLRQHWGERARANKRLQDEVFALAYRAGWRKDWPKFDRVMVTIVGFKGDRDNGIGGCKPIIDALWRNDLIRGDSADECVITYSFLGPADDQPPEGCRKFHDGRKFVRLTLTGGKRKGV